jgi:hypothetical protein
MNICSLMEWCGPTAAPLYPFPPSGTPPSVSVFLRSPVQLNVMWSRTVKKDQAIYLPEEPLASENVDLGYMIVGSAFVSADNASAAVTYTIKAAVTYASDASADPSPPT